MKPVFFVSFKQNALKIFKSLFKRIVLLTITTVYRKQKKKKTRS